MFSHLNPLAAPTAQMAPPRPPPELNDDAVREILVHLPPDDPARLLHASLVSKRWCRILSDPGFLRRYRRFHRTPPLLGFFHDVPSFDAVPRFVPTAAAAASPFRPRALDSGSWAFDCRHGRVLLEPMGSLDGGGGGFLVWDPVTGGQVALPEPDIPYHRFAASVLCAARGCDHLHCAGGPFAVVFVGSDTLKGVQRACVYSSEAGAWSKPAAACPSSCPVDPNRGALVGDKIFFTLWPAKKILKYDWGKDLLSVIDPPDACRDDGVLMGSEIGMLGLAGVKGSRLHLWSKKVEPEEGAGWLEMSVTELDTLIPKYNPYSWARVIGFAEAVGAIFIKTYGSVFIFELKSGKMRQVCKDVDYNAVLPFTSFYTPGCAHRKLSLPAETN